MAGGIRFIAFDMFGTLVHNDAAEWRAALHAIAHDQALGIEGNALWKEWSTREVAFRKTRTNMSSPASSPPFRTYRQAWRDAFVDTFRDLRLAGDAETAADFCVDALTTHEAFADAPAALEALRAHAPLAVLSNADDRFLDGTIAHNGWAFDAVVSSENARAYKPDPRIFATLCQRLGALPNQILYVGDSPYDDVHGAGLAGMRTVLVRRDQNTPGRTPPPEATALLGPDFAVGSLTELVPLAAALTGAMPAPAERS
ncbi:MAG: HAD-IA family hydrolase [Chloroflexota bacterium]